MDVQWFTNKNLGVKSVKVKFYLLAMEPKYFFSLSPG